MGREHNPQNYAH